MNTPFIVAEISKNWRNGWPENGDPRLLSQLFEHVINVNQERGYRLHSFQLHRAVTPETDKDYTELNETIVAVFEQWRQPRAGDAVDPSVQDPGTLTTRGPDTSSESSS